MAPLTRQERVHHNHLEHRHKGPQEGLDFQIVLTKGLRMSHIQEHHARNQGIRDASSMSRTT